MKSEFLDKGRVQAMELLHRMNTRLLAERNYPALTIGQRAFTACFHDVVTIAQYNEYLANFTASGNANVKTDQAGFWPCASDALLPEGFEGPWL
jgi:hypothetical protein